MRRKCTCETISAVALHIREVSMVGMENYKDNPSNAKTLCGAEVARDTKLAIHDATCYDCRDLAGIKPQ